MNQPSEREEAPERTHGFAPMDTLSDVCGAYTSDGYCWRPKKHPIHGAGVGMSLYECNKPEQRFNAEREKKVAEHAATRMRERCVDRVKELRDGWRERTGNSDDPTFKLHYQTRFDAAEEIRDALESLTLDGEKEQ